MNRKKISRFDYAKVQYYFDIAKKNVKILTPPIPPPLVRACSSYPNTPRWCELAARTQFKIQNSQFTIQNAPHWCELAARTPIR